MIIPTYNRSDSVEKLLKCLSTQSFPSRDFEVIVSIDGSTDTTQEIVDSFQPDFKLISIWQPNSGRAAACNRGIQAAAGEVIILLDDDMEPSCELVSAHYSAHSGDARIAVVGAAPILITDLSPPVVKYIGAKFNAHIDKISVRDFDFHIRDFYTGNFSIRKDVLLEVGMFNEVFKVYGNEDVELAKQLMDSGVKLVFSPHALAIQHYDKDYPSLARDYISKGITVVQLASQHPDTFHELRLSGYKNASRKWYLLRSLLLRLSMIFKPIPQLMISFIKWAERISPDNIDKYYTLSLDYFFWLGVCRELKKDLTNYSDISLKIQSKQ